MFAKYTEKIAIWVLITVSVISLAIGAGDLFFNFESIPYIKKTPQITLLLLGLLCFSVGIERLSNLENISRQIKDLRRELECVVPAQFFQTSYDAVLISTEFIKSAKQRIDVLTYALEFDRSRFDSKEISLYQNYTETVLNSLKTRQNLEYRVIWGYRDKDLFDQKRMVIENRKVFFQKEKVLHKIKFRARQTPSELFILMVDNKSLLIGFPSLSGDIMPRSSIKFTNHPELLSSFSKWYEDYLWNDAQNV